MADIEFERVLAAAHSLLFGGEPKVVRIGRYEVVSRIGSGGMSVVYEARDPLLGRRVAVKVVSSLLGEGERRGEYEQRLLREGEALASVSHPNVVSVLDVGNEAGTAFLVLELVDGEPLHAWLASEKRSWTEVLDVMMPAAEGLAAAHAAEIVHRDVTPRNIVLDRRGAVRVVDFGLVRATNDDESGVPRLPANLTQTGVVLGTPLYMAPEQWLGGTIDSRTDQFGFCATLFEALYGQPPFRGEQLDELKHAITTGAVEGSDDKSVPRWLHDIVVRGLCVDPDARHRSMAAMVGSVASHRASLIQTTSAEATLGRLRALLAAPTRDLARFERMGFELRSGLDAALTTWPGNERASALRREALVLLIDHEVEQGNAEAATRLLAELENPAEGLVSRVHALRSRAEEATSRLRKLERIERAVDLNAENSGKFRIMMLAAMSQALVFSALGYLGRTGTYAAGALTMGVFYSVYLLPQLGAEIVARRVMHANDLNRRWSQFGALAVAAHAAMFLVAHALQLPVATAFTLTYVMSTALWSLVAVVVDGRAGVVPPVTILAGAATMLWPLLCFEFHAFAAAFGIGGVALAMRYRRPAPRWLADA